jgi:tRNA A-37 threonylcarbamoyl transferase component Bud32
MLEGEPTVPGSIVSSPLVGAESARPDSPNDQTLAHPGLPGVPEPSESTPEPTLLPPSSAKLEPTLFPAAPAPLLNETVFPSARPTVPSDPPRAVPSPPSDDDWGFGGVPDATLSPTAPRPLEDDQRNTRSSAVPIPMPFVGPLHSDAPAADAGTLFGVPRGGRDDQAETQHFEDLWPDASVANGAVAPNGIVGTANSDLIAGRYSVVAILGRGGMGVVYKARDIELNRLVALKMILTGRHASDEEKHRFRLEANAAAALQHPNIVQIFNVGVDEDKPWIALEFVEGQSLHARISGKPWDCREAAQLIETLALAMDHAHTQGIIHRDLKPANVLLTAAGVPKITDFGLAKRVDQAGGDDGHTGANEILGTPSYMAPEQALGKNSEVGPLADVYALGVMLYELTVGRVPFRGETALETIQLVQTQEAEVPPASVPLDLRTICLKCLEKHARNRYSSARELAEELRRFLEDRPILARPVPWWERTRKWASRRPAAAALLAVSILGPFLLLTVSCVFIGFLLSALKKTDDALKTADRESKAKEVQRIEAEKQTRLAEQRARQASEAEMKTKEEKKAAELAFFQAQKAVEALLQGASNRGSRQDSGALPIRNEMVRQALSVVKNLTGARPTKDSRAQFAWANRIAGDLAGRLGEREASLGYYRDAINTYQTLLSEAEDSADASRYRIALAETFLGQWFIQWNVDPTAARHNLDQALQELKSLPAEKLNDPASVLLRAQIRSSRATHFWAESQVAGPPGSSKWKEQLEKAKDDYREALEELKSLPRSSLPRTIREDCDLEWARVETNLGVLLNWIAALDPARSSPDAIRKEVESKEEADTCQSNAIRRLQSLVKANPREPSFARELSRAYVNEGTWWGSPFDLPNYRYPSGKSDDEDQRKRAAAVDRHIKARYVEAVALFEELEKKNHFAPDYVHLLGSVLLGQGEYLLAQGELDGAEEPLTRAREKLLYLSRWFQAQPGYQLDLARACNSLGLLYLDRAERRRDNPLESWNLLARGQRLLTEAMKDWLLPLRTDYSDNRRVRQALALVANNLLLSYHRQIALLERVAKNAAPPGADDRRRWGGVERSVAELADFYRSGMNDPENQKPDDTRRDLATILLVDANLLLRMKQPEDCVARFEEIARLEPSAWTHFGEALSLLASCEARLLGRNGEFAELNAKSLDQLDTVAVALLRQAVKQKEWRKGVKQPLAGKEFEVLWKRPRVAESFSKVRRVLENRDEPSSPRSQP